MLEFRRNIRKESEGRANVLAPLQRETFEEEYIIQSDDVDEIKKLIRVIESQRTVQEEEATNARG